MVAELERLGTRDRRVLEAMGRVARERFVAGRHPLSLVFDVDQAIAIKGEGAVTSSLSAPRLVAAMLEMLDLEPGMRVLEVGTGTGYNAALLRELVGPAGSVATVDIDPALVDRAAGRLAGLGYGEVLVAATDGYFGLPSLAPFDRVVATVGCADLSPAWIEQAGAAGFVLVPLQHGGWHPLTRIEQRSGAVTGRVVGRSGFVAIQGRQAASAPWTARAPAAAPEPRAPDGSTRLPADLAAALAPEAGRERICGTASFDLDYLVALEDARSTSLLTLDDGRSSAWIDAAGHSLKWCGADGEALRDRLLGCAAEWRALGSPPAGAYVSEFERLGSKSSGTAASRAAGGARTWQVERLDYRQVVSYLAPASGTSGTGETASP